MSNNELELVPFLLRDGEVSNTDKFVMDVFYRINPRMKTVVEENELEDNPSLIRIYKNEQPDTYMRYNTIAEIDIDGCMFVDKEGGKGIFYMSYGRWDASQMEFNETNTVGVPDVPLVVESNTKEGVQKTFYNLLDDVVFIEDVQGYEGVKKWRGILKKDNRAAIFTRRQNGKRIYYGDFTIYAKAYNPDRGFEDSQFVE